MKIRRVPIVALAIILSAPAFAQYEREEDASIPLKYFYIKRDGHGLRSLLTRLNFSFSTGYGSTPFKHDLKGFGILQKPDSIPKIFIGNQSSETYSDWVNKAQASPSTITPGTFLVSSDTATLGFKSKSFNIPFKASVHLEFDKYRIGGGYSIDYFHIGEFTPVSYGSDISSYRLDKSSIFLKKYFVLLGASFYRYNDYLLAGTIELGGYNLGKSFDKSLITKGIFLNGGVSVEREFSEYLRVFIRPSYDLKSYKMSIPETGSSITNKLNTFYVHIGLTYRIPELPKCFIKDCKVQIDHAHGNKEYRSRVHPFYKKQNPHYGENYPTLIKYKGSNKRKLNPY